MAPLRLVRRSLSHLGKQEIVHARHHLSRARRGRVRGSDAVRPRAGASLRGGIMLDLILGLAVAAGLLVYLGAALIRPDRF
ncbi:K(+)-transporting ATPase subunit F [Paracoccus sp. NSM]|uniref:K(+)-transporting ATPase subunit F n=1 Tax=Paracoccus sp. NSM TaxID=3457784 RepID=UPI004036A385